MSCHTRFLGSKFVLGAGWGVDKGGRRSSVLAGISMLSAKVARELFLYVVRLAEKLSDISYFQQR